MKIAVLISGGVDSAVVVHRLKEEGHDLHLFIYVSDLTMAKATALPKRI